MQLEPEVEQLLQARYSPDPVPNFYRVQVVWSDSVALSVRCWPEQGEPITIKAMRPTPNRDWHFVQLS